MRIEIGTKIKIMPTVFEYYHSNFDVYNAVKDLVGTIVDVNHEHRHFTVEYEFPNGMKFRETFKISGDKIMR